MMTTCLLVLNFCERAEVLRVFWLVLLYLVGRLVLLCKTFSKICFTVSCWLLMSWLKIK